MVDKVVIVLGAFLQKVVTDVVLLFSAVVKKAYDVIKTKISLSFCLQCHIQHITPCDNKLSRSL